MLCRCSTILLLWAGSTLAKRRLSMQPPPVPSVTDRQTLVLWMIILSYPLHPQTLRYACKQHKVMESQSIQRMVYVYNKATELAIIPFWFYHDSSHRKFCCNTNDRKWHAVLGIWYNLEMLTEQALLIPADGFSCTLIVTSNDNNTNTSSSAL